MAKKVLNLRSGVEDKQPTQDQLEYGQIAINYFKDKEKVFFKNTSNEVVDIIPSHEVDTRIATATNDMLTKTVADSTYQAQGDYVETNTYNSDKATFALKTEIPSVNLSSGYTESSLSNEELEPKPNESFETAIGKLHKAIKDNEVVESTAFDTFRNSCGFDNNALYKPKNELISGTTSLSDAMEIVAENTKILDKKGDGNKFLSNDGTYKEISNNSTVPYLGNLTIPDYTQSESNKIDQETYNKFETLIGQSSDIPFILNLQVNIDKFYNCIFNGNMSTGFYELKTFGVFRSPHLGGIHIGELKVSLFSDLTCRVDFEDYTTIS